MPSSVSLCVSAPARLCDPSDFRLPPLPKLTRRPRRMSTKLLRILSFLGKAAGLALTIAGPSPVRPSA